MTRTSLLVAVLVASTALLVSTGAVPFPDGTDEINNVDIEMSPADGPNGKYAVINQNGEIELLLSDDNPDLDSNGIPGDSRTPIHRVFTITNNGTETARVWIEDDADDVRFYRDDDPENGLEGPGNELELGPGETIHVGLLVDTRGDHDVEDVSQFTVHAEQGTPTPIPTPTDGDGTDGEGDDSDETDGVGENDGTDGVGENDGTDEESGDNGTDGESDGNDGTSGDTIPPSVSAFDAANPEGQNVSVSFDSDEELSTINVTLRGPENATLTEGDFTYDSANGTYAATYDGSRDGTYSAALTTAKDGAGNDGATGQLDTVTVDTTAPTIDSFAATNPRGQDVSVSFNSTEPLAVVNVTLRGPENATLTEDDFVYDSANSTYAATYDGSNDGTYTATLHAATDTAGNDGALGQNDTVEVDTADAGDGDGGGNVAEIGGFEVTTLLGGLLPLALLLFFIAVYRRRRGGV